MREHVDRLIINDLNPGIAAFWRAVFDQTSGFLDRVEDCEVTIDEWHVQRAIYEAPEQHSNLDLAFATFFLNRCNRSGILSARPIGGLDQTGTWKINARFNKSDLTSRIERLGKLSSRVTVRQERAIDLLRTLSRRTHRILLYVDPPYVVAGEELYLTSHTWDEQERLSKVLTASPHPWLLSYDIDVRTRQLYGSFRCLRFDISHTAQVQKVGQEYMFFSTGLRVPDRTVIRTEGEWVPAATLEGSPTVSRLCLQTH